MNGYNRYGKKSDDSCPACFGTGIQNNKMTGLRVTCPVCLGTGKKDSIIKKWKPKFG